MCGCPKPKWNFPPLKIHLHFSATCRFFWFHSGWCDLSYQSPELKRGLFLWYVLPHCLTSDSKASWSKIWDIGAKWIKLTLAQNVQSFHCKLKRKVFGAQLLRGSRKVQIIVINRNGTGSSFVWRFAVGFTRTKAPRSQTKALHTTCVSVFMFPWLVAERRRAVWWERTSLSSFFSGREAEPWGRRWALTSCLRVKEMWTIKFDCCPVKPFRFLHQIAPPSSLYVNNPAIVHFNQMDWKFAHPLCWQIMWLHCY